MSDQAKIGNDPARRPGGTGASPASPHRRTRGDEEWMSDMSERFPLSTSGIIPRWFVLLWDSIVILTVGVGAIGLAVQLHPGSVLLAVIGALMIGFVHREVRGLANPDRNFVQLESDHLYVEVFGPISAKVPYVVIERVDENAGHSRWWPLGYWPYSPFGRPENHVHVRLRRARFLNFGWGRPWPWVRVIHLDVINPERFAAVLRERVAGSAAS